MNYYFPDDLRGTTTRRSIYFHGRVPLQPDLLEPAEGFEDDDPADAAGLAQGQIVPGQGLGNPANQAPAGVANQVQAGIPNNLGIIPPPAPFANPPGFRKRSRQRRAPS